MLTDEQYKRCREAASKLPCPTCKAPAEKPCVFTVGGAEGNAMYSFHIRRYQDAIKADPKLFEGY
jgi:hypothetical protein